jgi:divinyl chlorophyllide a 8-vinyl-reductase
MADRPSVLLAGATGYIGHAFAEELLQRGYQLECTRREGADAPLPVAGHDFHWHTVDLLDWPALDRTLGQGAPPLAVVSCIGSRTGGPADATAVELEANRNLLRLARRRGAAHFLLLSAICVQKPRLAFQHAKLAFEKELRESGLHYSIVRPTAFFKSLAGQVEKVRAGKPFYLFGDGLLTACKPISQRDLAAYMADCLEDPGRRNRVLPIGGPGPALTPLAQGEMLFRLLGREPRFRRVPTALFDVAEAVLAPLSRLAPSLADKAEFARIGRYYATESMLLWDREQGRYDADATPAWGRDTLEDFYRQVLTRGMAGQELGAHKLF